jgi:heme A synthase
VAEPDPLRQSVDPGAAEADDWPARASATIVDYVATVRDKTTGPALVASRTAVYGIAIGLITVVVAILVLILLVRLLVTVTAYAPGIDDGEAWLAYFVLGAVFVLVGLGLWRMKEKE